MVLKYFVKYCHSELTLSIQALSSFILTHKHSDTHAAHGNNAGDVQTPAALRTHQASLGTRAASHAAASSLLLISRVALLGVAGVLLRNNVRIVRRRFDVIRLHSSVFRSDLRGGRDSCALTHGCGESIDDNYVPVSETILS